VTCQSLINDFLLAYHSGALTPARKLEFELHLTLCGDCRKYVDSYRKTVMLAKASAIEMPAPPELVEAILHITSRTHGP
jgi:anti-sigma factor RsiW